MRTLGILLALTACGHCLAANVQLDDRRFTIPDGFQLERVTGPNITKRPIVVDFDEQGRLYVAESSGSNDNVQKQLKEKPHSILRIEDTDGDGRFDKRSVFADRMMFPEGAMWHDGSLYVAAPPSIWKLTDTNDDGVADRREEWFDGKTLTGCANDLHGPYLGPDGWIYWCKGAFAEQTYDQPGRDPLVTRAAHIFRRRPQGGPIESVMTGGMDNPVEVVFTAGGERIFTTTFFQHPANGQRDGLVHAIYGGVYGKQHGVIDGHPRTGNLMPVMTHLGAAAPSGLVRFESNFLGFENQLATACFNLHKVTRHELIPSGSTYKTIDHDLVASDDLDFHPTDVIEDADGSLLIVDTGGWYKLCCPTSQLHKPDVLGAIYRLSRTDGPRIGDARGQQFDWANASPQLLARLLGDKRPVVRRRAISALCKEGNAAVPQLSESLAIRPASSVARLHAVWTLCRIEGPQARAAVRTALSDADETVRQAAIHAVSIWRDREAIGQLKEILKTGTPPNRRAAAEAMGRLGSLTVAPDLLAAMEDRNDRVLDHSLIYALIEADAPRETRLALDSDHLQVQRAALISLNQMSSGGLEKEELCMLLNSDEPLIREIATTFAMEHPEWGHSFAEVLKDQLQNEERSNPVEIANFASRLATLSNSDAVRKLVKNLLEADTTDMEIKLALFGHLDNVKSASEPWDDLMVELLESNEARLVSAVVRFLTPRTKSQRANVSLTDRLVSVAKSEAFSREIRLMAIQDCHELDGDLFAFVLQCLAADQPTQERGLAASAISRVELTQPQLFVLADGLASVGPLELSRLLEVFDKQDDEALGMRLIDSLKKCPTASALPPARLATLSAKFGTQVSDAAKALYASSTMDPIEQSERIDNLLTTLPAGDLRRGQRIFHSEKTACFACHAMGYRGGTVGPDLTRIARIRSPRDLLEAVLYPSASFVRSYEPVTVLTADGRSVSGTIKDQTRDHVLLHLSVTEQRRVPTSEIEEMLPGKVSVMPAGLDKQLSEQELADLLEFLRSRK